MINNTLKKCFLKRLEIKIMMESYLYPEAKDSYFRTEWNKIGLPINTENPVDKIIVIELSDHTPALFYVVSGVYMKKQLIINSWIVRPVLKLYEDIEGVITNWTLGDQMQINNVILYKYFGQFKAPAKISFSTPISSYII